MIYIPEPPDWFKHEPAPDKPAKTNYLPDIRYSEELNARWVKWHRADDETRYWQWVRYYTNQMRRIVPELFGVTGPAFNPINTPGTWSAVDPGSATSNFIPGP